MKKPAVKTAKFSTGVYRLLLDTHVRGECIQPDEWFPDYDPDARKEIYVDHRLKNRARLDTLIHECTHAEFPYMKEADVDRWATNMARLLWRLGYRCPDDV